MIRCFGRRIAAYQLEAETVKHADAFDPAYSVALKPYNYNLVIIPAGTWIVAEISKSEAKDKAMTEEEFQEFIKDFEEK